MPSVWSDATSFFRESIFLSASSNASYEESFSCLSAMVLLSSSCFSFVVSALSKASCAAAFIFSASSRRPSFSLIFAFTASIFLAVPMAWFTFSRAASFFFCSSLREFCLSLSSDSIVASRSTTSCSVIWPLTALSTSIS